MNAAAWVLLAFHLAILVAFLYVMRHALRDDHRLTGGRRVFLGIVGLMALAPCIIIPVCAKPGDQPGLERLITFLAMPAVLYTTQELLTKRQRAGRQ